MIRPNFIYEDNHVHLETIGLNYLLEEGFGVGALVKVHNPLQNLLYLH